MARPKGGYKLKDGTRVPGVTTIIGRFKESGGLIHWAHNLGLQGIDYRQARDKAADAGTLGHDMIEAHIKGEDPYGVEGPEDLIQKATQAYQAFVLWFESNSLEIVDTEMTLVSEKYRFGGTPDALGKTPQGDFALLDWKTSNRIYQDYLIQIACYARLLEENGVVDRKISRFHLLRVGKEYCDFHHHSWPREAMEPAWRSFELMRELYDLDKELKGIAGT
jgi:predicted RecB family nuclease